MKKSSTVLTLFVCFYFTVAFANNNESDLKKDFVTGNPGIESVNAIAFGPEGILFIGDSKRAAIFAIDTKDIAPNDKLEPLEVSQIDKKIAALIGADAGEIEINDMAVNPISKQVYFGVERRDGMPVLLRLNGETLEVIPLNNLSYSTTDIDNPLAEDAKDSRGRPLRVWTVSDIGYHQGKVMVSGLSNHEFSSTFRSIPFPFSKKQIHSTLEIYHAAHGRYETYAPIKTFMAANVNGKDHLVASYTCTPLVLFPLDDLIPGTHVKGRTIAELGNSNTPLDMITLEKDGEKYLLLANSNRAVMRISFNDIEKFKDTLTDPVKGAPGTAGVTFLALPFVNVLQLDKLDDTQFLMLQRRSNGDLDLRSMNVRW